MSGVYNGGSGLEQSLKAILFDVDGTLADTEEAHRTSFNRAFHDQGLEWHWDVPLYGELLKVTGGKERIRHFVETRLDQPPAGFSDDFVKMLHQAKTRHYTTLMAQGDVPLRPGIERLIRDAHAAGLVLAIATTTTEENVSALLQASLGLRWQQYFAEVGCGDVVPHKKPAPDIYHWVLDRIGLAPSSCIALEDSNNGLRSSLAAGIRTVVTVNAYTRHQDFTGALAVLDDLADLGPFYALTGLKLLPVSH